MKTTVLILVAMATSAIGCSGGPRTEESSVSEGALFTTAHWQKIYECNDGSVVDVNTNERRELQFAVRSTQAIDTLQDSVECGYYPNRCPTNAKGEFVFQGRVERGVFSPSDFSKFIGYAPGRGRETPLPFGGLVDRGSDNTIKFEIGEYGNWIFRGCKAVGQ